MTVQYSETIRHGWLDFWETSIGASPKMRILTGAQPASCAAAQTGTLLAEFALGADWSANAAANTKSMNLPLSTTGLAAGTAGHYRIVNNAGTVCHEQGAFPTDATIDNPVIAVGQAVNITGYSKTAPGV